MKTDYSEYILSASEKRTFIMVGYILGFAVTYLFYHSVYFSLAAGILPIFFLNSYSKVLAGKRRNLLLTQFKDLLYSLSASIAAGRQMAAALSDALEALELMYDGNTPIITELKAMVRNINENRDSEEQNLLNLGKRSHCEDIQNFAEVYAACRKTGGNINKVIRNTADILIDKITIQKEIKTLTAQKKLEGRIITAMPLVVTAGLDFFSPEYLEVLYTTAAGRIIMTAALLGIGCAWIMTERITGIEI